MARGRSPKAPQLAVHRGTPDSPATQPEAAAVRGPELSVRVVLTDTGVDMEAFARHYAEHVISILPHLHRERVPA